MTKKIRQTDYTAYGDGYQLCLPLNSEIKIPKDEPARLLSAIVERMDLNELFATYCENGRNEYSPKVLLKICVYGYMRKILSSRELERACRENINFMYLLGGKPVPDHNTIARFRSAHLSRCQDEIQAAMTRVLMDMGEVSFTKSAVFIDGTKIESVGNRYKFVWKKSCEKNYRKLQAKMREKLPELVKAAGLRFYCGEEIQKKHLKKLRKKVVKAMKDQGISAVSGKGKHKTTLQRLLDQIDEWTERIRGYQKDIHICGNRNSYCKTDREATFMRMKEDHMRNGQLKPGYNVNVATASEYILGTYVSSDRTDQKTTIPFMEKLRKYYSVNRVVYDSGYESEENYRYFAEHPELDLYVKPSDYEQKKEKKYRTDISRRENMTYDAELDQYTCANGKLLKIAGTRKQKTESGYVSVKTIYECSECAGCPMKAQCIRSKSDTPLEKRHKRLEVATYFAEQRALMEEKIGTTEGKLLRMNRSIQSEGVFGYVKTDLQFRRFSLKGIQKVGAEWTLLAMAFNILKLHHKTENGRLGTHLFALSETA